MWGLWERGKRKARARTAEAAQGEKGRTWKVEENNNTRGITLGGVRLGGGWGVEGGNVYMSHPSWIPWGGGCILTEPLASPPRHWTRPQSLNPWLPASSFNTGKGLLRRVCRK